MRTGHSVDVLAITLVACGGSEPVAPDAGDTHQIPRQADAGRGADAERSAPDGGVAIEAAIQPDSGAPGDARRSEDARGSGPTGDAGSQPADALHGAYGFLVGMSYSATDSVIQAVMNNPDVDGVFIGFPWSDVAPTAMTTDFSKIDAWLAAAAAAGKRVSLGIEAGSGTPSWVGSASDYLTFTVYDFQQATCQASLRVPIPWHQSFLDAWKGLVQALATHLQSEPAEYAAVSAIKLTGINDATYETSLPYEAAATHGTCTTTDAAAAWNTVGYTDALVEGAWQTILGYYDTAFPDKALCMQYIDKGFPAEYVGGSPGPMNNDVSTAMVAAAQTTLGTSRFVIEGTGLSATGGPAQNIDTYASGGGVVGYQTLYYVYGSTTCVMNNYVVPCDETVLHTALELGITHQMKYVELYHEDILGYPAEVSFVHGALSP